MCVFVMCVCVYVQRSDKIKSAKIEIKVEMYNKIRNNNTDG